MSDIELQTECFEPVGAADLSLFAGFGSVYPTGRTLSNTDDAAFAEEWAEDGAYDGKLARLIFLFSAADMADEAGAAKHPSQYPWDERIARVILLDQYEEELMDLRP